MNEFYDLYKELSNKEDTKDKKYTNDMNNTLSFILKVNEDKFEEEANVYDNKRQK